MHPSALQAIEWDLETNNTGFNENVSTFTRRLDFVDRVDISQLDHSKIAPTRTVQYRGEGTTHINGIKGGKITTRHYLTGHESSTAGAGAATPTDRETLLGVVFGGISTPPSGTTLTGGTATAPATTASGTFPAGGVARIGTLGDNRGNGQFYPISTHVTTTLTLLGAMDAAGNNGDVLYSPTLLYEQSDPTATYIRGIRMRFLSANLCYEMHGCHAESVRFGGIAGGQDNGQVLPWIEITWDVGEWFVVGSVTFPSTVAVSTANPAPCAGGSFDLQAVGTTTRNRLMVRDLTIAYNLKTVAEYSVGSIWQYSRKTGARRLHDNSAPQAVIDFLLEAPVQSATPLYDAEWLAGTGRLRGMLTCSAFDGSALGFLWRSLCWIGKRPTMEDLNGKSHRRYQMAAYTGATLTNDLTRAAQVMVSA